MPLKYKVITLPSVDAHVFEIVRYIANDSPQAAATFIENFEKQVRSLEVVNLTTSTYPGAPISVNATCLESGEKLTP